MGAGVIPFCAREQGVDFLFQTTFSGRKAGCLIDFGGGLGEGEDYQETAIREFVEETETLYFADDLSRASRSEARIEQQIPLVAALFDKTLQVHPDWWCRRAPGKSTRPKQWRSYFIEFPWRDVAALNREWAGDHAGRFKKRRELFWVPAGELLRLYEEEPQRLWKRVRQLEGAPETIRSILRHHGSTTATRGGR